MAREHFTEAELSSGIVKSKTEDSPESLLNQPRDVDNPLVEVYSINGECVEEDSKQAYAKKEGEKFYIKSNGGILFDPRGLYDNDRYKRIGDKSIWGWKRVGVRAFEHYVAYLTGGNQSHYRNAGREIM